MKRNNASSRGSSRRRYQGLVEDYRHGGLDDVAEEAQAPKPADAAAATLPPSRGKRREYLREYLRWLWPHRVAVGVVFLFSLFIAGLQMIEPLFMRFIIDRVLLNTHLDSAARMIRLNLAGATFLSAIVISNLLDAVKNYRQ